jgi:hypothetical protein
MSVGGTVIETIVTGDLVWINTKEKPEYRSECAIYVENTPEARSVSEGDIVWWQGQWAMWTPKDSTGRTIGPVEVKLKRRGFSGVARPAKEQITA